MPDEAGTVTTVLVVDDDADTCDVLGSILREEGYEVLDAHHGQAAQRSRRSQTEQAQHRGGR